MLIPDVETVKVSALKASSVPEKASCSLCQSFSSLSVVILPPLDSERQSGANLLIFVGRLIYGFVLESGSTTAMSSTLCPCSQLKGNAV